jgi:N-acyl homoserine lactone hydrolase
MQVAHALPTNNPVVCYLVQTGDGQNILIDSGLPGHLPADRVPPGLTPVLGKSVIEQLGELGIKPADINLLICTHFDMDHAGHHSAFTNAEFIVQRTHYGHAYNSPRFALTRPEWDRPDVRFRFVDGDTQLLPGLDLIETSGHTLGHQSVLVRLPEMGPVLLAIDAVRRQSNFEPDHEKDAQDEDEHALRTSTRKLLDTVEREKVSLVVFGHDPQQWQTLRKAPAYYE